MTEQIFPPEYRPASGGGSSSEKNEETPRYLDCRKLEDGESVTFRLCGTFSSGHVISGYFYFTEDGAVRRFPHYPENYLDDIGLTWDGKNNGTGERDRPRYFLAWACLIRNEKSPRVLVVPQKQIRTAIEGTLKMADYEFVNGMANFYMTVTREGVKLDTSYPSIPTLKPPTTAERAIWDEYKDKLWLPALFANGDPFAGQPSTGNDSAACGLPPTARDVFGADQEIGTRDAAIDELQALAGASGW